MALPATSSVPDPFESFPSPEPLTNLFLARVDGTVVVEGIMTFALGPRSEGGGRAA